MGFAPSHTRRMSSTASGFFSDRCAKLRSASSSVRRLAGRGLRIASGGTCIQRQRSRLACVLHRRMSLGVCALYVRGLGGLRARCGLLIPAAIFFSPWSFHGRWTFLGCCLRSSRFRASISLTVVSGYSRGRPGGRLTIGSPGLPIVPVILSCGGDTHPCRMALVFLDGLQAFAQKKADVAHLERPRADYRDGEEGARKGQEGHVCAHFWRHASARQGWQLVFLLYMLWREILMSHISLGRALAIAMPKTRYQSMRRGFLSSRK